jgi:hypothetical protein
MLKHIAALLELSSTLFLLLYENVLKIPSLKMPCARTDKKYEFNFRRPQKNASFKTISLSIYESRL